MTQPDCGCFAHMDITAFAGCRCEHGETGDQSDQGKVIVALPFVTLTADSES
jgi:hypothetical protein